MCHVKNKTVLNILGHHCETDIDECATTPCRNGTCTNFDGGFTCNCNFGYTGEWWLSHIMLNCLVLMLDDYNML